MMSARTKQAMPNRRGALLIVAIVCVGLTAVVLVMLTQLAVAERRALRTNAWQVQAAWLVESGLERAAARLAGDPEYQGENWTIAADLLPDNQPAVVRIQVEPSAQQAGQCLVRVEADYPDHPQHRARQSKQVVLRNRET